MLGTSKFHILKGCIRKRTMNYYDNKELVDKVFAELNKAYNNKENRNFGYEFPENKQYEGSVCWLSGGKPNHYSSVTVHQKKYPLHRITWILTKNGGQQIPHNTFIRHLCNTPRCINPNHLIPGTTRDNIKDKMIHTPSYNTIMKKLKDSDIIQIREYYATDMFTQDELSDMFNVSRRNISKIVSGITWKHLGGPISPLKKRTPAYHPCTKLNLSKAQEIKSKYNQGTPVAHLAKEYNVSISSISQITRGITYKDLP